MASALVALGTILVGDRVITRCDTRIVKILMILNLTMWVVAACVHYEDIIPDIAARISLELKKRYTGEFNYKHKYTESH